MAIKIALVSYDAFEGNSTGYYPPVHLCNLGTSLRQAGHDVRVFDYSGSFSHLDEYAREIADFGPAIVGMTCYTPLMRTFSRVSKTIRAAIPKAAFVVGGPQPTVWPKWTLTHMDHFDYAMAGECDRSIVRFVGMIEGRVAPAEIPGLVYRENDSVSCNEPELIEDLDTLPNIDRSLLDQYYAKNYYWDLAARGKLDVLISSRGCPYDCSFCFKLERRYRFFGVDHVMAEFEAMYRRGVRSVHVQDDAFTAHRKRCETIADRLIERRFGFDIKVRGRVNTVHEDMFRRLKQAGVKQIIFGLESGSQKILDSMNKNTTIAQNKAAIDVAKKVGLSCYGEILVGMPGEDHTTVDETIAFLLKKKPIVGFASVLYPLPSTPVYEEAKRSGTLQGDWSVDGGFPWIKLPWTSDLSDLHREAARINRAVQTDPGILLYFLRCHIPQMGLRQLRFLTRLALSRLGLLH